MEPPSVKDRLSQLRNYGIHIESITGNQLPKGLSDRVGDLLEDRIPEFVIPSDYEGNPFSSIKRIPTSTPGYPFFSRTLNEDQIFPHAEALAKSTNGKYNAKYFSENVIDKVEIHGFYDPYAEATHFFPWPSRSIMKD